MVRLSAPGRQAHHALHQGLHLQGPLPSVKVPEHGGPDDHPAAGKIKGALTIDRPAAAGSVGKRSSGIKKPRKRRVSGAFASDGADRRLPNRGARRTALRPYCRNIDDGRKRFLFIISPVTIRTPFEYQKVHLLQLKNQNEFAVLYAPDIPNLLKSIK